MASPHLVISTDERGKRPVCLPRVHVHACTACKRLAWPSAAGFTGRPHAKTRGGGPCANGRALPVREPRRPRALDSRASSGPLTTCCSYCTVLEPDSPSFPPAPSLSPSVSRTVVKAEFAPSRHKPHRLLEARSAAHTKRHKKRGSLSLGRPTLKPEAALSVLHFDRRATCRLDFVRILRLASAPRLPFVLATSSNALVRALKPPPTRLATVQTMSSSVTSALSG